MATICRIDFKGDNLVLCFHLVFFSNNLQVLMLQSIASFKSVIPSGNSWTFNLNVFQHIYLAHVKTYRFSRLVPHAHKSTEWKRQLQSYCSTFHSTLHIIAIWWVSDMEICLKWPFHFFFTFSRPLSFEYNGLQHLDHTGGAVHSDDDPISTINFIWKPIHCAYAISLTQHNYSELSLKV